MFEAESAVANGKLYMFGGFDNSYIQVTNSFEVYDPSANTWTLLGNTPAPQTHVGTATDGRIIYFAGGFRGNWYGQASSDFWEYDTVANTWTRGPSLPAERGAGALVLTGRQLHFFGGAYGPTPTDVSDSSDHWMFDLDNPSVGWITEAPLPDPRNHLGYAVLNGKIYAIGGQHQLNETTGLDNTVNVYDPSTNSWAAAASLPALTSHLHNSTFVYDGRIICVGGTLTGDVASNQILAYDPTANSWSDVGSLPQARSATVAQSIDGEVIVATGTPTGVLPQTQTWARPLDFLQPVSAPAPVATVAVPRSNASLTVTLAPPTPTAMIAGVSSDLRRRGTGAVSVVDSGTTRVSTPFSATFYLSQNPAANPATDSSAVRVAADSGRVALRGGKGMSLHTHFTCPDTLAAGQYYLVAQISLGSARARTTAVVASPTAVTVSAPVVDLSAALSNAGSTTLQPGGIMTALLAVLNTGNVPLGPPILVDLSAVANTGSTTPVLTVRRLVGGGSHPAQPDQKINVPHCCPQRLRCRNLRTDRNADSEGFGVIVRRRSRGQRSPPLCGFIIRSAWRDGPEAVRYVLCDPPDCQAAGDGRQREAIHGAADKLTETTDEATNFCVGGHGRRDVGGSCKGR